MEFKKFEIEGLVLIKPKKIKDERGYFLETFRKNLLENILNQNLNFCQSNLSHSKYGTIRGLHFQNSPHNQSKLISVINGEILDVVVDFRKSSKTYGQVFSVTLSEINNHGLYIPKGFAHGFSVLSEVATIFYQVDNYYSKDSEGGINPLDRKLNIDWKIKSEDQIISDKDRSLPNFDFSNFY